MEHDVGYRGIPHRFRDLPEGEREAFVKWLGHSVRPIFDGLRPEEQDFFFPWDYILWKKSQRKID